MNSREIAKYKLTPASDLWCMDSGSEEVVTNNEKKLRSIRPINKAMQCANTSDIDIQGVGPCELNFSGVSMTFKGYFSPSLMGNFLSVAKICDLDYDVFFTKLNCYILKSDQVIVVGMRPNGTYNVKAVSLSFINSLTTNTPEKA